MSRTLLPLVLILGACSSAASTDSGSDECDVTISKTFPAANATDAYYRGTVEFTLTKPDESATVTSDVAGTTTTSEDGLTIVFTPDAPLSPSTSYTFTLHYCGGDAPLTFTTSALGTPVTDPASTIKGSSYLLDLKDARVTEPAGVGDLLASNLDGVDIYVNVTDLSDTKVKMIGAMGNPDAASPTQDWCSRTIDFPEADFSAAPHFELGGEGKTTISVAGYAVDIQNLHIAGDFSADGSYFGGGTLSGTIDTRPLDQALMEGDEGAICNLAGSIGATCQACDDGQPFCLTLKADSITAAKTDIAITPIYGDDCLGCDVGVPADTSETCEQMPQQ